MKPMRRVTMVGVGVALATSIIAAGCSSGKPSGTSPPGSGLTVGELLPFSGPISAIIKPAVTGVDAAVAVINANGGVLGHPLKVAEQDTAGDMADAVTAWRALQLRHPVFELGPSSLESAAVIKLYDGVQVPDFNMSGDPQYDQMTFNYVFRLLPSDSVNGRAMAFYGTHAGIKRAALMITSDPSGQSLVPALTEGFRRHGGTIVYDKPLTPGQPSYKAEIEQIFSNKPDAIFFHTDEGTAGTLFHDMASLGDLNVPIIGDQHAVDINTVKAMGIDAATKYLVGISTSSASSPALDRFTALYTQYEGAKPGSQFAGVFYDGVNVFALAMLAARSTDPKVFVNDVTKVTSPDGSKCYEFVTCAALLRAGKTIHYDGASNSFVFDKYHNVFGDYTVLGWHSDQTNYDVFDESAAAVSQY